MGVFSSFLPLLESGEGTAGTSQSIFSEDVSVENGDKQEADSDDWCSVLMLPMPRVKARVAHDAGGNGAAGAASFSATFSQHR